MRLVDLLSICPQMHYTLAANRPLGMPQQQVVSLPTAHQQHAVERFHHAQDFTSPMALAHCSICTNQVG
jgi:hypothetical protein